MNNLTFWILVILAVVLILRHFSFAGAKEAVEMMNAGATLVDVRTKSEYEQDHIEGSLHIPLDRIEERIEELVPDKDAPILLYCLSGARSGNARRRLSGLGYTKVKNLGSIFRARSILESKNHREKENDQ